MLELIRIDGKDSAGLERCWRIRRRVFVEEQKVPESLELDGLDAVSTHFLASEEGQAIGTARLRVTKEGLAKAERVAVLEPHRGRGVGARLMDALEAEAARLGFGVVVLTAQESAIDFYARRGYIAEGPLFFEANIPHRKMSLALGSE